MLLLPGAFHCGESDEKLYSLEKTSRCESAKHKNGNQSLPVRKINTILRSLPSINWYHELSGRTLKEQINVSFRLIITYCF
jgi:hypothetical protein